MWIMGSTDVILGRDQGMDRTLGSGSIQEGRSTRGLLAMTIPANVQPEALGWLKGRSQINSKPS